MRLVRIFMSVIALALGSLVLGAARADALSACPPGQSQPGYPIGACMLRLTPSTTEADESVTADGGGYRPGSQVNVTFNGVPVGTATADSSGAFSLVFKVPAGTAPGAYRVLATGIDPNGEPYQLSGILQVVASEPDGSGNGGGSGDGNDNGNGNGNGAGDDNGGSKASGPIPRTGTTPAAPVAAGLALLAAGAVLLVAARRRKLNLA